MTWFKVDDKFHGSVEVMSIPLQDRAAAIGLWTLAGSWSSDHLQDGFVPVTHLETWGGSVELADLIVTAKLWVRVGKRGYKFRNWEKWQITRDQVELAREAERDRKAAWRAAKAANKGDGPAPVPRDKGGSPVVVPSFPTRPDPTRPDPLKERGEVTSPFCARHPTGTDEPCGPCRTARLAFEAEATRPKPTPVTTMPKPSECAHPKGPDENGYCTRCGDRIA